MQMDHHKRLISVLLCGIMFFCNGCTKNLRTDELVTVIVPVKVLNIASWTPEEAVLQLTGVGEGAFSAIETDEGGNISIQLLPEQMEVWKVRIHERQTKLQERVASFGEDYRLEFSDECQVLDLFVKAEMSTKTFGECLLSAESLCALYQLFSGVSADDWYVAINIYNAASGNLVKSGDSNSRLTFNENDWKASE